jgi:hypothetical protein
LSTVFARDDTQHYADNHNDLDYIPVHCLLF